MRRGKRITEESPSDDVHALRKRCKELRYLLEVFRPVCAKTAHRRLLKELKSLQDTLGDFQDGEVQREAVREFAAAMMEQGAAPPETVLAMGEMAAQLDDPSAERAGRAGRPAATISGRRKPGPGESARALMKIYATYNIKGGVGKTSAAVNLAHLAAQGGYNVLLWDLDPQGAATYMFRVRPKVKGGGRALVDGSRTLDDAIKATDFDGLDLLPADFSYRNMDVQLDDMKRPTRRIRQLLRPMEGQYDVVFLDCPPSISLLSENVLHAVDTLLVPMIPATLSVRTFDQLTSFVSDFDGRQPQVQRVLLDGGPAQAVALRPGATAVHRTSGNPDDRDSGVVDHRADGRTSSAGDGFRAAQRRVTLL